MGENNCSILITGGAGYVGSLTTRLLLEKGYKVTVLDNLSYGGLSLLPCFSENNFQFVRGDIRDRNVMKSLVKAADLIIHLAAVVGFPACKKDPDLAMDVNVNGTRVLQKCRSRDQGVIFASTSSMYGAQEKDMVTEESPPNPLTTYGITKAQAEELLMSLENVLCYRFATGFGISPRMRLDLMINDFVYQAVKLHQVIVYEKSFKRAFIHVRDMARSILFAVENFEKMRNGIFNVGSPELNLSKEEIAEFIKKKVNYYIHYSDVGSDRDRRNYSLSYEKIHEKGFSTEVSLEKGISELIQGYKVIDVKNHFFNV
jgi:nucleoside-diphosphate-sugar epimerase